MRGARLAASGGTWRWPVDLGNPPERALAGSVPAADGWRLLPALPARDRRSGGAPAGDGRIQPGLIYLHPYDMDPACPRLPARWYFLLMRYYRLGRTEGVLRRLLRTFRFTTVADWLASRQDVG